MKQLRIEDNKIAVSFPYNYALVEQVKKIQGREWDVLYKVWRVPLNKESVRQLKYLLFDTKPIEEVLVYNDNQTIKRADDCATEIKTMIPFLYDFQQDCVIRAIADESLLIADDMGLGKTIESLSVAYYNRQKGLIKNIVIVCPASIKAQWQREAMKWFKLDLTIITGTEKKRKEQFINATDGIIINYEQLLGKDYAFIKEFVKQEGILIFDEASYLKNEKAKRTIIARKLRKNTKYCLALTGTPIETKLKDGFNIATLIKEDWMSTYEFYGKHCVYDLNDAGYNVLIGYKNIDIFMEQMKEISIRRLKTDVKDMPNKVIYNRIVELSPQQKKLAKMIQYELQEIMADTNIHPIEEFVILPIMENAVQLMNISKSKIAIGIKKHTTLKDDSPKLKEMVAVIEEMHDKKVVIFTRFKKMIPFITATIGESMCLVGSGDTKDRLGLIDEFRDGDKRFLIVTEAFSYGVDMPFATALINFDIPWNHAKLKQREDRIYRITSKEQVTIVNLITDGFENYIYQKMLVGKGLADKFSAKRTLKEYLNR